jgi:hypothetical protein
VLADVDPNIATPTVVTVCAHDTLNAFECADFNLLVRANNDPEVNLPD